MVCSYRSASFSVSRSKSSLVICWRILGHSRNWIIDEWSAVVTVKTVDFRSSHVDDDVGRLDVPQWHGLGVLSLQ